MIALATSSLHWPTKLRPSDRAAKALSYKGPFVSTMVVVRIY